MHASKDSIWREMWKILQNFQGTKQGPSMALHSRRSTACSYLAIAGSSSGPVARKAWVEQAGQRNSAEREEQSSSSARIRSMNKMHAMLQVWSSRMMAMYMWSEVKWRWYLLWLTIRRDLWTCLVRPKI